MMQFEQKAWRHGSMAGVLSVYWQSGHFSVCCSSVSSLWICTSGGGVVVVVVVVMVFLRYVFLLLLLFYLFYRCTVY